MPCCIPCHCIPCHCMPFFLEVASSCSNASATAQQRPQLTRQQLQVSRCVTRCACCPPRRYKPKQLTRDKALLKGTLTMLCQLCCEPVPEDYDDAQTLPASKMAAQVGAAVRHACSAARCSCAMLPVLCAARHHAPSCAQHWQHAPLNGHGST